MDFGLKKIAQTLAILNNPPSNLIISLAAKISSPLNVFASSSYFAIWITILAFPVLLLPRSLMYIGLPILTSLVKMTSQLSKPFYTTEPISTRWFFYLPHFPNASQINYFINFGDTFLVGGFFKVLTVPFIFPRLPLLIFSMWCYFSSGNAVCNCVFPVLFHMYISCLKND